jgi:glutamine---fructose-6-phosphate transaminase (isomerizing)
VSDPPASATADPLLAEIGRQPAAIRGAAVAIAGQLAGLVAFVRDRPGRRIVVTGMGSSFDAGHALVASLGPAGVPVDHLNAAELLHFGLPTLDARTTLIVVSQSGRSVEVVRLLERIRERPARPSVIAVTNGAANPLADAADIALDIAVGDELGPATMTFAATLVALDAIARLLGEHGRPQIEAIRDGVTAAADTAANAIEWLLADRPAVTDTMVDWHGGRRTIVVVSRGVGRAASDMASLTLKEVAGVAAESLVTADFRHGPLELVGEDLAVAFLSLEPSTDAIDRSFAAELAGGPASVVVIGPDPGRPPARSIAFGTVGRSLAAAVAVVPFQLLAREVAMARGRTPGDFRYASKITTVE